MSEIVNTRKCIFKFQDTYKSFHRLRYNSGTRYFEDNTGVRVQVPGFGETTSVEYLSSGMVYPVEYFHTTVQYFVDRGYERGNTIRAAPYDWRLAAGLFLQ